MSNPTDPSATSSAALPESPQGNLLSDSFFVEHQTENLHLGFRITRCLLSQQTPYQKLDVFETVEFGKLMTLDDKVMLTERDEFFYHEMLVHPAMLSHPQPRRVALIGGGDGGAVREILQHPSVEEVVWVEIDGAVVEASRQFFPTVSQQALSDPRVKLHVAPGEAVLGDYDDSFDVLIVDSTDPIGPAVPLFEAPFFKLCQKSLKAEGIYVTQCGTPLYFPEEIRSMGGQLRQVFESVRFYTGFVPFYPSGLWAYGLGAQVPLAVDGATVAERFRAAGLVCRYFTPELHGASAVLPQFVRDLVAG
jgi:spermidine synthase